MKMMAFNTSYICKLDTMVQFYLVIHVRNQGEVDINGADTLHEARAEARRQHPHNMEIIQCSTLRLWLENGGYGSAASGHSRSGPTQKRGKVKQDPSGVR